MTEKPEAPGQSQHAAILHAIELQVKELVKTGALAPRERLLSRKALLAKVPLSYPTILKFEKEGRFPKRRKLPGGRVAWIEAEVDQWFYSLPVVGEAVDGCE